MPPPATRRPSRARLVAGVVFACSTALAALLLWRAEVQRLEQERSRIAEVAGDHAQALQRSIERALTATYALAALVKQGGGRIKDFDEVATQMLPFYPGVAAIGLAPGGVVRQVVPLAGNERSIGFNQLADSVQNKEALLARDTGRLTLAGPIHLVQGGLAAVGRLPVFLDEARSPAGFWGFTYVILRFPQVLEAARLSSLEERGHVYELWRNEPGTGRRQVIARSAPGELPGTPVERSLEVPNGAWTLSVVPRAGWREPLPLAGQALLGLFVSLLLAWLAKLWVELKEHELGLQDEVEARTAEILAAQHELRAMLDAIPDPLFELSLDGRYHVVHSQRPELLVAPHEVLLRSSVRDVMSPEAAAVVLAALQEANERGGSYGREILVDIKGRRRWFELSVSRKPDEPGGEPRFMVLSRDISRRKQAQAQLALIAKVFEQSGEGIMISDAQPVVLQVNRAFTQISGYSAEEVVGKRPLFEGRGRMPDDALQDMQAALALRGRWEGEVQNRRKDGRTYPQHLSITRVDDEHGQVTNYISTFRDITQSKEAEDRIRRLAHYDPLTGLPNRTLLADRSAQAIRIAQRNGTPLALLFLDLDHFKHINDSLGHRVGDQLLVALAARLQTAVREQDTVSRLGGDEFILVLPGTDADGAARVAQKLLELGAQPYPIEHYELSITPSIGVAMFPGDGHDFDTLSRRADAAMYRAKQDGRNHFRFFTEEMQARSARILELENALRRALAREQFRLHYQPQVCLDSGQVVGAEVLLRWQHPELGAVSPAEFIPVAEESGQVIPIGEWVLRTAVRQLRAWRDAGLPPITLAVNLSAVQFRLPHLPELVTQILADAGLAPEVLELELTEGAAMDDPRAATAMMNQLHERGVQMAIDDFGTGYSSLSYLKRFQVHKLKIDQSFVRDLTDDPEDRAIVSAVIGMARALGMQTVAEGVETEGQLAFLRAQGCDGGQGYLFCRPLEAEAFEAFLRARQPADAERSST